MHLARIMNQHSITETGLMRFLQLKKYLFLIQEITEIPFQRENAKTGYNRFRHFGCIKPTHYSIGNSGNIFIEPPAADYFKEDINEKGIHTDNGKKQEVLPVIFDIYPPVTRGKK